MARKIIAALIASLALSSGVTASPLGKRTWFPDSGVPGILQSCVNPNHLALTWDDGPSSFTTTLLASLKSQGVPASFFVLGPQVELYPSVVKAAFDAGHEILSHGWSHSDQTTLTDAQIISELNRTEAVIVKVIGKSPALFRMPYGEIDSRSASAIRSRGYELVGWNFDSNGNFAPRAFPG